MSAFEDRLLALAGWTRATLLADGEDVTLVFSDGELICADRPTAR